MPSNPGATPIPDSPLGVLRHTVGDTSSTPLDPPVFGQANYAVWSDAALNAALLISDDNILRAAGNLYRSLAVQYIQSGKSIRTDDLAIDTRGRGGDLMKIAQTFFDQADGTDSGTDFFKIVPFGGRPSAGIVRPEASPWPLPYAALSVGDSTPEEDGTPLFWTLGSTPDEPAPDGEPTTWTLGD